MTKVAINGRTLPLAPIAGGFAGIIAFAIFLVMPQGILESLVWQTRLDLLLPAAQPPLGATARILVAVVAALAAAGITALLAVKFAKIGTKSVSRRRRRPLRTESEGVQPPVINYTAPTPVVVPAPTAVSSANPAPEGEKKRSILDRLRRHKTDDEIDVENMPTRRRRDFHPDAPARRPLFADVELPGKTLDTVNMPEEQVTPVATQTTPIHERAQRQLPAWAYEEECDLSGLRSQNVPKSDDEAVIQPASPAPITQGSALTEDRDQPLSQPREPEMPVTMQAEIDEDSVQGYIRPNSAGTADWDDPSAFDSYIASLEEAKLAEEAENAQQVEAPNPDEIAEEVDGPADIPATAFDANVAVDQRAMDVASTETVESTYVGGDILLEQASPVRVGNPAAAHLVADEALADGFTPAEKIEAQLASTDVDDRSVDDLMVRLQEGMARRAQRRARQKELEQLAVQASIAIPAPNTADIAPLEQEEDRTASTSPIKPTADSAPVSPPVTPINPFASIDPLADLADKEAEVDEALRAALSTLERMNRRVG